MYWVRRIVLWVGRLSLALLVLGVALIVFWNTASTPVRQDVVFQALAQTGCVPNANLSGTPPDNGCPLPASVLNRMLHPSYAFYVVQNYGAVGNGSTNDTPAVNLALAACGSNGGGYVYFPPSGASYRLQTALSAVPAGCQVHGMGGFNAPVVSPTGADNTEADWTKTGTWFRCEDTVNTCVNLANNGASIEGVNFWYTQPTPSSTTCASPPCAYQAGWTPTTYPYTVTVQDTAAANSIDNVVIVNGYDCIDLEGTGNGLAMMRTYVSNVLINCFDNDFKFNSVDNTLSMHNIREDAIWYQGSLQVFNFVENTPPHGIGWKVSYLANIQATNVEISWKRLGILLTDGQAQNGFGSLAFAGADWQISNISFNEVCQAMSVANGTTHFAGGSAGNGVGDNYLMNVTAFADTNTSNATQCAGKTPIMFNFASDNVAVDIIGLNVGYSNTIAQIGGGSSGWLRITNARAQQYSAFNAGQPAYIAANGAYADIHGDALAIVPASGAGPYFSGSAIAPFPMIGTGQVVSPSASAPADLNFGLFPPSPSAAGAVTYWGWRMDTSQNFALRAYSNGTYAFSPLMVNRENGATAFGGNVAMTGDANASKPSIVSGFGSSPSVVGSDNAGRVTVGTGGASSGVIAFGVAFVNQAPSCVANDETTSTVIRATATTSQVTLAGSMNASDTVSFLCIGIQ